MLNLKPDEVIHVSKLTAERFVQYDIKVVINQKKGRSPTGTMIFGDSKLLLRFTDAGNIERLIPTDRNGDSAYMLNTLAREYEVAFNADYEDFYYVFFGEAA